MVKRTARFYGPIIELSRLQSELNRLFAAFVETNDKGATPASSWDPNVDVVDDGEMIRILVELPGVEAGDVKRLASGAASSWSAAPRRAASAAKEGMRFFCMERYFGGFLKSIATPAAGQLAPRENAC